MAMYCGVDGAKRKLSKLYAGRDGAKGELTEMWAGGEGAKRKIFGGPLTLSHMPVGSSVFALNQGVPKEHIIVHQGLPSDQYDPSCDGVWVTTKYNLDRIPWALTKMFNYAASNAANVVEEELSHYDSGIRDLIKQVKIPYYDGDSGTLYTGSDGFLCKAFLLSALEVGFTKKNDSNIRNDGIKLDYFPVEYTDVQKRADAWNGWFRTPHSSDPGVLHSSNGFFGWSAPTQKIIFRVAMIFQKNTLVDEDGNILV